jgi:hypothetical protein
MTNETVGREPRPEPQPEPPVTRHHYARYTGAGAGGYLPGVPARDLTRVAWEQLDPALRALALSLGLFELNAPAAPAVESE